VTYESGRKIPRLGNFEGAASFQPSVVGGSCRIEAMAAPGTLGLAFDSEFIDPGEAPILHHEFLF